MSHDKALATKWLAPPDVAVKRDKLCLQLEIYEESILLRNFDDDHTQVKFVSADEIAMLLTQHIGHFSGLLPTGTLWWQQGRNGRSIAIWKEPSVRPIALQREPFKPPQRLSLPMPGAVFLCAPARAPHVFACPKRPQSENDILYRMPTFNVFSDGRVCAGNHEFPPEVNRIPDSFFESFFSLTGDSHNRSKKHPTNLLALWDDLEGSRTYPTDDLVPHATVGEIISALGGSR